MNIIQNQIFKLADVDFQGNIIYKESDSLYVKYNGTDVEIGYGSKAQAARALFQLAVAVRGGKKELNIYQKPHFDTCGVMINAARAMPTVDSCKDYIVNLAAMGMNMLMLYCETNYKMDNYRYFGYKKNPYTTKEFNELDAFAESMGVEMIPCIQTYGHLSEYLSWPEAAPFKNTNWSLMTGNEKAYEFIEEEIKAMRKAFKSKRIHVGMDEVGDLAFGNYYKQNGGSESRFDIFNKHLKRVVEICKKYDFEPMIWSDMYFSLSGKHRYDFDELVEVPKEAVEKMSDAGLVFWDYYHDYESFYDVNIKKHLSFGKTAWFAGGVWDFDGYAPNYAYTLKTMNPALKACLKNGLRNVFSTTWGSGESNYMETLFMLPVFSEHCYLGEACTDEDIMKMSCELRNLTPEFIGAVNDLHLGYDGWASATKRLVYCDSITNLTHYNFDLEKACRLYKKSLDIFENIKLKGEYNTLNIEYLRVLTRILLLKSELLMNIQPEYKAGNRDYLREAAEVKLPKLIELYTEFIELKSRSYLMTTKRHHLDFILSDLYAVRGRCEFAITSINDYLNSKTPTVYELELETHDDDVLLYQPISMYLNVL